MKKEFCNLCRLFSCPSVKFNPQLPMQSCMIRKILHRCPTNSAVIILHVTKALPDQCGDELCTVKARTKRFERSEAGLGMGKGWSPGIF